MLTNISHAASQGRLSDEIDQILIGPAGVFVVEVKHWDTGFLKQRPEIAEAEAERVNQKAKRIAGKLRSRFDPGFVAPRLLLTRGGTGLQAGKRVFLRGVPVYGLGEWKELVEVGQQRLAAAAIDKAAQVLEPATRLALGGDLRTFADLINLERQPGGDQSFHRVYRGQHKTRRDRVILHLYDLSASDENDPLNRAEREFQVIQRWQKSPYLPSLLDSFQDAEHYPGELCYFSIVDPAAASVAERMHDNAWHSNDRVRFAREALLALATFHQPTDDGFPPLIHRHITPHTLRVRHNGRPLFTDFSLAKLGDAKTISVVTPDFGDDTPYVAPEVLARGLAAADARSDIFALCKTLAILFPGDDSQSVEVRGFLEIGSATDPEGRESLLELAAVLERHSTPAQAAPPLPSPQYWDEETIVPFHNAHYKIVSRLGSGGIGETFKVIEVDDRSNELYGTYVAKLIRHEADAESALRAYRKARAYTTHPHLSAIHEIAPEWRPDRFMALLRWIEGTPLADLTGVLPLYAEDLGERTLEAMLTRWLIDLCDALWQLHRVGLVHGDVSPSNIIVQGGEVVLTDYDTVTDVGSVPRQRNPLYASSNVEAGISICPCDDIFALAATLFRVIFEREPFMFTAQRVKTKGMNWDGVDTSGLPRIAEFLAHATIQGFADASVARAYLANQDQDFKRAPEPPPPAALVTGCLPRLRALLSAYPGSRHGNAETRGLDSDFAADTYVETRLDVRLREDIRAGRVGLAILFGNAGDGKTAFLQHLLKQLGLPDVHSSHRILERRLPDGRTVLANLDGSAAFQGKSANELLDQFFKPFESLEFDSAGRHPRVLAINSGKLLEWLDLRDDSPLGDHLYTALFETDDEELNSLDPCIRLIDLNRRSLVGGIDGKESDFLNELLDRFIGKTAASEPWDVCRTCSAQERCTAWHSVQTLRDPELGPRIRRRLSDALQACHLRGEIHITARELRAAIVFIFFGVHDCTELHADPELDPLRYWDRAFAAGAMQRQGELLAELARFDPALDSNPILDRRLLRDAIVAGKEVTTENRAATLASARRRAWFEWGEPRYEALHLKGGEALTLTGGRYLDRFRRVTSMSGEERDSLCRDLCRGIARLEDLPNVAFEIGHGLPLRVQPRTPTESLFWVIKPWDRFKLEARLPQAAEGLEVLHTHLRLTYRYATGKQEALSIGLELFHLLLALKDGGQLSGTGQEGIFAHLEIFTQRLAQEDARELYGWHPGADREVFRLHVEARDGRQVLVREAA